MTVQIVGLMAAEGGRGKTGLLNLVSQLDIIKHWDDIEENSEQVTTKPSLTTALSTELFPSDYDLAHHEQRIALGYMGSESDIKIATELADKSLWKKGVENPEQAFIDETQKHLTAFKKTKDTPRLTHHLRLTARDVAHIAQRDTQSPWKSKMSLFGDSRKSCNLERKFNQHAENLYSQTPKPALVTEIQGLLKDKFYEECHLMLTEKISKGYLGQQNIDATDKNGDTLLHLFIKELSNSEDSKEQKKLQVIIDELLKLNPDLDAENGDEESIRTLLDSGYSMPQQKSNH